MAPGGTGGTTGTFVGRARELALLEAALEAAAAGAGSTVLVSGEAGIGKTRLLAELADRALTAGATVLSGRCIDLVGTGLPYLPFVEALRPLRGSPALATLGRTLRELPRLVPELGGSDAPAPELDRTDARLRLFDETLAVLEHIGAAAPVALVLEDLHWADESTLDLAAYLAHALRERPLLLAASYRSDELSRGSPLPRFATELQRAGAAALELLPLPRDDLELLVADLAGPGASAELTEEVCARSDGNPFFAEELLAAAARDETEMPHVLRDLLLRRVAQLDASDRSVLRIASAVGRDVPYRLLAEVSPLPKGELVEALRRAVEHDVLSADQSAGAFRFRHALLAEAVYATLLPGEREELHARLALALAAQSGPASEIAQHWAGAGRTEEALAASLQAAREAERVSGFTEASRHLDRAFALWPASGAADTAGLDLPGALEWAAELAMLAGPPARAAALVRQALELVEDDDPLRAAMLYLSLGTYVTQAEGAQEGLAAKHRAVELVPADPPTPELARALSGYGRALTIAWRHAESAGYCEEAIRVAQATGAHAAEREALATLGVDLCYLGQAEDGLAQLEAARRSWEEHGGGARELANTDVFGDLSDTLNMLGRYQEAARVGLEGRETAARLGVEGTIGMVSAANAVEALFALGDWERAREAADRALRPARRHMRHAVLLSTSALELGLGDVDRARARLDEAADEAQQSRDDAKYAALLAELELWEGRLDDAREVLDHALVRIPHEAPFALLELCALGLRVEAEHALRAQVARDPHAAAEVDERARRLLGLVRDAAGAAVAITPVADGWRALAEAEHERLRRGAAPEHWAAAAAAWDGLEQPYRAAYCRWREAEALVAARGSRTAASLCARRAYETCGRLGAQRLGRELELLAARARLDLVGTQRDEAHAEYGSPLGLTARESEVMQLLARGYTNREIAAELTISVKTASVHVTHILRKLDVSNRGEAAALAHRLAPPP